jgi:hypothetical protein
MYFYAALDITAAATPSVMAVVLATRAALGALGIDDALALSVDDRLLFHDDAGRPGDLPELVAAAPRLGTFKLLRLAVQHHVGDLHVIIEVVALGAPPPGTPAIRVAISARLAADSPRVGEHMAAYATRLAHLHADRDLLHASDDDFRAFVARVASALAETHRNAATVLVRRLEARVVLPAPGPPLRRGARCLPTHRRYEPYDIYVHNPLATTLELVTWQATYACEPPLALAVIDRDGADLGDSRRLPAAVRKHPAAFMQCHGTAPADAVAWQGLAGEVIAMVPRPPPSPLLADLSATPEPARVDAAEPADGSWLEAMNLGELISLPLELIGGLLDGFDLG